MRVRLALGRRVADSETLRTTVFIGQSPEVADLLKQAVHVRNQETVNREAVGQSCPLTTAYSCQITYWSFMDLVPIVILEFCKVAIFIMI